MSNWKQEVQRIVQPAVARSQITDHVVIDRNILTQTGELVSRSFAERSVMIFADTAGYAACGLAVADSLNKAGFAVSSHIIPNSPLPQPHVELADTFVEILKRGDFIPISVGSGVMNDLVKYAAFEADRRYVAVATASSMDGYASAGAPLSKQGFKITIPTRAPKIIIADLDIISAAPPEMTGWGYGDLAGKFPAAGDWILADFVGVEPIDEVAWPLVQDNLKSWLVNPNGLANGDFNSISSLFTGLTVVGFAMEFHGTSRPASGAEHQIAHMWEMEGLSYHGRKVSHGACVSVGTVTSLALFDWLIEQDLSGLDAVAVSNKAPTIDAEFQTIDTLIRNTDISERAKLETRAKHIDPAEHRRRLQTIIVGWSSIRDKLEKHLIRSHEMAELLLEAGAPVAAENIGVTETHHRNTVFASRFIRRRYTVLDFLHEVGLLEAALGSIFPEQSNAVA